MFEDRRARQARVSASCWAYVESPAVIESHAVKIKGEDAPLSVRFLYFLVIAGVSSAPNGCARLDCEALVREKTVSLRSFNGQKQPTLNDAPGKSGLLGPLLKLFKTNEAAVLLAQQTLSIYRS